MSAKVTVRDASPRVIVMGDLIRGPDSSGNLRWLAAALSEAIGVAGGTIEIVQSRDDGGSIDIDAIYDELGLSRSPEAWAQLATGSIWPEVSLMAVDAAISSNHSWVVGFALPPIMMRRFAEKKIPFLDLEIHPIRFAQDLFLRARTNCDKIAAVLEKISLSDEDLWVDAALQSGHRAVFAQDGRYGTGARIALFVGQARIDASLIENGKIVSPESCIEDIKEFAGDYDYLLIRPHPYEANNSHLLSLVDKIDNAAITLDPTYDLLRESSIKSVLALSSSVLREAPFYGKTGRRLITSDFDSCSLSNVVKGEWRIGPGCFAPSFWNEVFHGNPTRHAALSGPGLLRHSYGRGWGHEGSSSAGRLPTLSPGTTIGRNGSRELQPALMAGWNTTEEAHIWSNGYKAWLGFLADASCTRLVLHVADFINSWRPNCTFGFRLVGHPRSETLYLALSARITPVDLQIGNLASNGVIIVEISCTQPFCPLAEAFDPPDPRTLGIALKAIEVR